MPPKQDKKEIKEEALTAVVVVDSFDRRFSPIVKSFGPWCLMPICNSPVINYTLSWIVRTECKNVILVVTEKNSDKLQDVEREWKHYFNSFTVVVSANAVSVGDSLRELEGRGMLNGDFLLISNPATITSSTLQDQITKFRERRRADKNCVMTLIYSPLENVRKEVVAVAKDSNRLRLYHRADDASLLDIDKTCFAEGIVIRRDISDTGIALCSVNIAAQFSDNFDFQNKDDVIREILVNEEILLQQIHVEVLPENEPSICVLDYESLLLATSLLLERWFYPIVPDKMPFNGDYVNVAADWNLYAGSDIDKKGTLTVENLPIFDGLNVAVGKNCFTGDQVKIINSSIGSSVSIGNDSEIFNCVIDDGCKIGRNCRLINSVLCSGVTIPDGSVLSSQTIVAANVAFPDNCELPADCVMCAVPPDEDDDDVFQSVQKNGVYLWRLADGQPFWRAGTKPKQRAVVSGVISDSDGDDRFSESDGEEVVGGDLDPCAIFLEEVIDSMVGIRKLEFSPEKMNNLILEINSSKLANNISMDDVAKNVFFAFLGLSGNDNITGFKELAQKWKALFNNYYKPRKSQIQLLLGLEEKHKDNPDAFTPKKVAAMVHWMYNDDDGFSILEEESILEWAKTLPDGPLKSGMQPIFDWLQESEDEDSDDDDSD